MANHPCTKVRFLTILILVSISTVTVFSFLPAAKAETIIFSITPPSGNVGTKVQLRGNVTTENGRYLVQFDQKNVTTGRATGHEVTASFEVPDAFAGDHNVTLTDLTTTESNTTTFQVLTSYSLEAEVPEPPAQLQEGDNVTISIRITGGEKHEFYVANVTVQDPANRSFTELLSVPVEDGGYGNTTTIFPFLGAKTNLTGEYRVFLNGTLATENFTVGLTDYTEYHRFQPVDVKATDYEPNENVTITVSLGKEVIHSKNVTAEKGIIRYTNWTIPSNASIGIYTLNVSSLSPSPNATVKEPPDIQNFTVPGFSIDITTRNLAEEPVPNITVEIVEDEGSVVNKTSNLKGVIKTKLEIGNYTGKAYWRNEVVGERWINITGACSLDFMCTLTNLRMVVRDEDGIRIPEVEVYLTPENQTTSTDINGTAIISSLLPNQAYVLNASRYGHQFNHTRIPELLVNETAVAWFNITITCPRLTLKVHVTDADNRPISDATVKAQELMGGPYYQGNTNSEGIALFHSTFGRYSVEVYSKGIQLNKTEVALFQNGNISIPCQQYGLTISVKVGDYFGQPISKANVTLQREGLPSYSEQTESNGKVTFHNIIGGRLQITVYLSHQTQPCIVRTLLVDTSKTIEVNVAKYVSLAGFLVETSQLTTVLVMVAAVIVVLSVEMYRRKHSNSRKS